MWLWIKRWRDWVMSDFWPITRNGPQPQALHYSYEKAGLTLHNQPIPWNAEAVLVEACIKLPASRPRRKTDFLLRLGREENVAVESMRRDEGEDRHRLFFRLPPPTRTVTAELLYQDHVLGQMTLPLLTKDDFITRLQLQMPTLFVRLADQSVACQTFVATQCRGLQFSAVLSSPTSLVPVLDLGLRLELRSERGGQVRSVPARLCSSQLAGRQALFTVVPRGFPRKIGSWMATWMLGDRPLAAHQVRAISQRAFRRSLRVSDTRFVVQGTKTGVSLCRNVPPMDGISRVGPCFLVSSREPGMAGLCRLQVCTQAPGTIRPPLLVEEEVLITDGPTMFAPGTVDAGDLGHVTAFELRTRTGTLGTMSLSPAPAAVFTSEGGFKASQEFSWTAAAEDELNDRLSRLLEGRSKAT